MGLSCKISYTPDGVAFVNESQELYNQALRLFKNQDEALQAWASSYSEEFESVTGKTSSEATIDDVVKFYANVAAVDRSLTKDEMFSVKSFMRKTGFSSLSQLRDKMNSIFRKDGKFGMDYSAAISSGLYSREEVESLNSAQLINILSKIEGELVKNGDVFVTNDTSSLGYKNSNVRTKFGTYEVVSESEVERDLLSRVNNASEIYDKVSELPYPDFVEKYYNSPALRRDIADRFSGAKRVPLLSIKGGELTDENTSTYARVKNTLLSNIPLAKVKADIEFLEEIEEDIWLLSQDDVVEVVKEVEKFLADQNIDVIGLSKVAGDRAKVLGVLDAVRDMIENPTEENIDIFVEEYNAVISTESKKPVELIKLPENYQQLNIVKVESSLSDTELFNNYGLIKVGDNLYHKVANSQKSDVYEFLYQKVLKGKLVIPRDFRTTEDLTDKIGVLSDLSKFVMARETGYPAELQEDISLNQLAFNHLPITTEFKPESIITNLGLLETDPGYLKREFTTDFYNYILEEKLKDSEIYRQVLSKFSVTDSDISLKEPVESIDDLKYTQELQDFIRLKKDNSMRYLLPTVESVTIDEDLYYVNNQDQIKEYTGEFQPLDQYLMTPKTGRNYISVAGKKYKKITFNMTNDLFLELGTVDSLYYTANPSFEFNNKEAQEVLEQNTVGLNRTELVELPKPVFSEGSDFLDLSIVSQINDSGITFSDLYSDKELQRINEEANNC